MASHGHDLHAPAHGGDKGAAFTGLVGGIVVLIAIVYGIVVWTNGLFAGHAAEGAAPAAQAGQAGH